MSLKIEDFERDIIIDETIIQNKNDYEANEVNAKHVKDILNCYMEDFLDKNNEQAVDFETALGSTLNIGKLLSNYSELGSDCVAVINSGMLSAQDKLGKIDERYQNMKMDLSDEIFAISTFRVVPNYKMNSFSYIRLEIIRKNQDRLSLLGEQMQKILRVMEHFLENYRPEIYNIEGFRKISEVELFAIGNMFFKFILALFEEPMELFYNGSTYTLPQFCERKSVRAVDILNFIASYPVIKEFLDLSLHLQFSLAEIYRWFPNGLLEIQKIGRKIRDVSKSLVGPKAYRPNHAESLVLKSKIQDSVHRLRLALYKHSKKYYNVGIDLSGEDATDIIENTTECIDADLHFICELDEYPKIDRSCLDYGDDDIIKQLLHGDKTVVSILQAKEEGDF